MNNIAEGSLGLVRLGDVIDEAVSGFCVRASVPRMEQCSIRMNNVTRRGEHATGHHSFACQWTEKMLDGYSLQPGDIMFNNTNSTRDGGKDGVVRPVRGNQFYCRNHVTRIRSAP